ncbi:hypothetical protein HYC85_003164 [Camellia sinensis]|uniref:Uncharacterized protein n=1 Tax=Camellia sinensis TaxID=4442 RepID=A0A7J7IAP8_CAMSI|nr:hypothetical protein HYC85_003164 [Camellia sinensis]
MMRRLACFVDPTHVPIFGLVRHLLLVLVLGDNKCTGIDHHQQASVDEREMGEEDINIGIVDFHFVDDIRSSCCYYFPFEIAEEMVEEQESYGGEEEEPSGLTEAMKTVKYERKFSTSLYAFNGISECLKLKLGSENREWSEVVNGHYGALLISLLLLYYLVDKMV